MMNAHMIKVCPQCGAASPQYKEQCWICHTSLKSVRAQPVDTSVLAQGQARIAQGYPTAHLVVLGTLLVAVVGTGLVLQNHWLLFPFLIIICPALLITAIRTEAQALDRKPVGAVEIIKWFALSAIAVFAGITLLIVGLMVALFALCYSLGGFQ